MISSTASATYWMASRHKLALWDGQLSTNHLLDSFTSASLECCASSATGTTRIRAPNFRHDPHSPQPQSANLTLHTELPPYGRLLSQFQSLSLHMTQICVAGLRGAQPDHRRVRILHRLSTGSLSDPRGRHWLSTTCRWTMF
jgi:hypothetical protein